MQSIYYATLIGHLKGRRLKPKIIKRYRVGQKSLCQNSILDKVKEDVFSYPMPEKSLQANKNYIVKGTFVVVCLHYNTQYLFFHQKLMRCLVYFSLYYMMGLGQACCCKAKSNG